MIVLATTEEAHHALPMAPIWFPVIALIVFALLLGVTYSFRNMWHRHDPRAYGPTHDQAGTGSGGATGSGGH